ncbi:MAG TPA: DNA translocase FtsK [Candidatus Saccharibacteria bacterium]|nr:DNA translocase FtsK [Candidatus Saccharibacteria bacterium]HMR38359.1 DNA translocase FtsK [Candidatus Saccharibacteria bacterium]
MNKDLLQQEIDQLLKLYDKGDLTSSGFTSKLISFINNQLDGDPVYSDTLGVDDELYSEVKEYIGTLKAVSTSAIQRRFKIGYAKASRLIDKLEEDELISPYNGLSEPRKVL